ncbi:MAG: PQQ-binding-like beta-propeller repeat protein [Planctomycetota bacterium]|nr:PQQ-binding-like beta-propeller repeat protein [Planctomycetota bacterium]
MRQAISVATVFLGLCVLVVVLATTAAAPAADQPQWGEAWSRNLVSAETGLPATVEPPDIDRDAGRAVPGTGKHVAWVVPLGTQTYSTPVVGGGRVLIGTNNGRPRNPRHTDDRSVLMCFDEADGRFRWQLVVPKMSDKNPYLDWPRVGIVSPATIEGDRAYLLTNRGEVVCLDMAGMANGNDGPFRDEARHAVPRGKPPVPPGPTDADILWLFDMMKEVGSKQHDEAHSSPMIDGRCLYVGTSNGVDRTHVKMITPDAPSLVCLDTKTGRLLAVDGAHIGPQIIHSQWSSASRGRAGGRDLVCFGGGDAVCYAFEPVRDPLPEKPQTLRTVWRFDCDPAGRKEHPLEFQDNRDEGPSLITGMPVFVDGRVYVTAGGDYWHGKPECWIKCIDASGTGDVTRSHEVWSRPLNRHCMSTPAVAGGLVYITDCGRTVHCFDAASGEPVWTHKTRGEIWSSPLVADGKVYVTTCSGRLWVLAAGRTKRVLGEVRLDSRLYGSPVAANGRLYVASEKYLYAFEQGATPK